MTSSVFFKFKSQKEPTRVEFDGTGISVFELKREIISKSGLGDGTDFDLFIYTDDNSEEYDDDTTIIPRSTTVIARRQPAFKPGAGRAARYVSGKMPVTAKNAGRKEQMSKASASKPSATALNDMNNAMTEEEKMAAMFAAQTEQWSAQQEEMSHQAPVFKGGVKKPANVPDHDPPNGYICYRCGNKGHWIQLCPTNDDPDFDNRPRVKRTTGIPRSFLQKVDKSVILAQTDGDESKRPSGIMVNAEGDFVIAEPDKASWEQYQAKAKSSTANQETQAEDKIVEEKGLQCSIDKKMFIEPMKTPCCKKTFCNDCITNALIESDFICPACQTEGVLIDDLQPDDEASKKIQEYFKEKEALKSSPPSSPSPKLDSAASETVNHDDASTPKGEGNNETLASVPAKAGETRRNQSSSPGGGDSSNPPPNNTDQMSQADELGDKAVTSTTKPQDSNPKKRPAGDLLENPKIPKAPKAMQNQQNPMNNMNNMMNGMPNMGMDMMFNGMPMSNMMGMPNLNMNMGMPMMPMMGMSSMPGMPMMGMSNLGNMNGGWDMMGMNGMNGMGGMNGMAGMSGMDGMSTMGAMNGMTGMQGNMAMGNNMGNINGGMNGLQNGHVFGTASNQADEDAYFRRPVNPHRHQRQRRVPRPSDYREL